MIGYFTGRRSNILKIGGQRTACAAGRPAAMRLSHGDGEGVKLVEKPGLCPLGDRRRRPARVRSTRASYPLAVARRRGLDQLVALGDAAQILVGDRDRMAEGVEQNGVGGLGPTPGRASRRHAEGGVGRGGQTLERSGKLRRRAWRQMP